MTTNFTYSKIIKPTRTTFDYDAKLRSHLNKFRGHSLDKAVHLYRMWFYFVRLAYECEKNKVKFGASNDLSVKLNKRFYRDWEIEKYLDAKFDDWFADHIDLFAEKQIEIVKEGKKSDEYLYIKFHRDQRKEDVVRQVRSHLKNSRFKSASKFPIQKQHKYFYLHQHFNVFILRVQGSSGAEVAYFLDSYYGKYSDKVSTSYSSLRRLFRACEKTVIGVSKGVF